MKPTSHSAAPRRFWLFSLLSTAVAALISACKAAPPTPLLTEPPQPEPAPSAVIGPISGKDGSARKSGALTPRAYREDGASHLYGINSERIYKGKLPPLLYAIGVLNVHIDRVGRVNRVDWMRAPKHAPEVVEEIERMVRQASPFPVPTRLGKVVYTDTWLWHVSGKFQLDTLTEGQS